MSKITQSQIPYPIQFRAARSLLGWSLADLVQASGQSRATVSRAETTGQPSPSETPLKALRFTYEQHGIEFLFEGGLGVRLRPKTES